MHQSGPVHRPGVAASSLAAAAASTATPREWPKVYGDFRSTKSRAGRQHLVEFVLAQLSAGCRRLAHDRVPRRHLIQLAEIASASAANILTRAGSS